MVMAKRLLIILLLVNLALIISLSCVPVNKPPSKSADTPANEPLSKPSDIPGNQPVAKPSDIKVYNTHFQTDGIGHFSFEYNAKYKVADMSTEQECTAFVKLRGPLIKTEQGKKQNEINVEIRNPRCVQFPNARALLYFQMNEWKQQLGLEAKVLDASEMVVDGVRADRVIYMIESPKETTSEAKQQFYLIRRNVFFDYNGLIWDIVMDSDSFTANEDADNDDFDHIVKTFKLLPAYLPLGNPSEVKPFDTYIQNDGIAHFSFEYSTKFKGIDSNTDANWVSILTLRGLHVTNESGTMRTTIGITVNDPKAASTQITGADPLQTSKDQLNSVKRRIEKSVATGFLQEKLLDQSEITVDGVHADQIVYLINRDLFFGPRKIEKNKMVFSVEREVFFDYNGLIWEISITSDSSTADTDKEDFEHVLKTFKFLP